MHGDSAFPTENWRKVANLLHELRPNGPAGFEGLVAAILEELTAKPFIVAKTGRQPRGDAISYDARVSLQAKRYGANTALDSNRVAADFLSVFDAVDRRLDVYVVAVTRESSQLRADLEPFERQTGVDIVVLADEPDAPELSALCVAYWSRVKAFFAAVPAELAAWIQGAGSEAVVQAAVHRTKAKVGESLNTFVDLRELGRKQMAQAFRPTNPDRSRAGVQIQLDNSIDRATPRDALFNWWAQEKEPNAFIEAEEGCGKSWVTAAFAEQLATGDMAPVVLWLESLDWSGCNTLDEVVTAGLRTVLPAGDLRTRAFADKIFRVWPRPALLVLNGVNEHGCLEAAQKLLRLYDRHIDHYPKHLRFLFTARPLKTYGGYLSDLWAGCCRISIGGFSDTEFDEALRRFAPEIPAASIPKNVREFAAVPRFFSLALRLREKLRDLGQLTKPVLLFADLIDKIERDPQLRRLFSDTPEAILAHLAKHSHTASDGKTVVSHQHFKDCFPDFPRALDDLAEQRIVIGPGIGTVEVNIEHVVLGFALHLLQMAEANPEESEAALQDRFATALEPNCEDDSRTEALYVALLLSLLRDPQAGRTWSRARRALLVLWCGGHNARRTAPRLSFWAHTDLVAYRGMVESMLTRYLSGGQDTELIAPIALRWCEAGTTDAAITRLLEDWLALVFPTVELADSPEEAKERAGFPHAESHKQLRLAFAAISILSLRPEDAMLPALVRCARSCQFCKVAEEMNGKIRDVRLKTPYENLGILLRWNYTEPVVPKLVSLARGASQDPAVQHGLQVLAECLALAEIPAELRRPKPAWTPQFRDDSPSSVAAQFRKWIQVLPAARMHWPRILHVDLLVEHPVAALDPVEVERLRSHLSSKLTEATRERNGPDEIDELFPRLFPWIARFAPATAQQLSAEYWSYAIRSTNPTGVALSAPILPLSPDSLARLIGEVRGAADRLRQNNNLGGFLTRFSKIFLLSGDESVMLNWFDTMLDLPSSYAGEEWRILPIPRMLESIATPILAAACWNRFEHARLNHPETPADRRVRYWLALYACLVRGSPTAGRDAHALLRTLPAGHPWSDVLTEIVAASGDAAVVDTALRDSDFRKRFGDPQATHHFAWFLRLPPETRLSSELQQLLPQLPRSVAAELLRWTISADEHLSFARLLADSAIRRAADPSALEEPGFDLGWIRTYDDDRAWWDVDEAEATSRKIHSDLSSVWGVNRGRSSDFFETSSISSEAALKERNRRWNDAFKRVRDKMKGIVDQYLLQFHGRLTVERWAQLQPDEFRDFAGAFFRTLTKSTSRHFELLSFCDDVLGALCTLDVASAAHLNDEFLGDSPGLVHIEALIPSFTYRVMESDLDGQEPAISSLRIRLLDQCRNDRELLATVMAAAHGNTLTWLRGFACDRLGASPFAKERAMAVSLVAFAESADDRAWLAALATSDPSTWVRHHAEWALKVHDQSATAKNLWEETLAEVQQPGADLLQISTRMARLNALLLPTAIFWPRPRGPGATVNALVHAFWYSWQSRGGPKAEREICGRKLQEYYRGEHLTDVTKRMAPWWNPIA